MFCSVPMTSAHSEMNSSRSEMKGDEHKSIKGPQTNDIEINTILQHVCNSGARRCSSARYHLSRNGYHLSQMKRER